MARRVPRQEPALEHARYLADPDPPATGRRGPNRRADIRGGAREPVPAANYGEALGEILTALDDVRAGLRQLLGKRGR